MQIFDGHYQWRISSKDLPFSGRVGSDRAGADAGAIGVNVVPSSYFGIPERFSVICGCGSCGISDRLGHLPVLW